jgi:hypothetical protein
VGKRVGVLTIRSSAVLIVVALLCGCDAPPSAEDVARSYPEFYLQALPIIGLHVDHDADGIIFRYAVSPNERPVWLQRISDSAGAHGWKVVHEGQSGEVASLHLQRIDDPRHRYLDMHSLEIVRITSCGSALLISGIQVDIEEQSDLAKKTAEGGRWYRKWFWPLVAKYEAETCGTQ